MKMSGTPVLGNWLLERTGCGRWNEALAGDLLEEFQQRRSRMWYWRQVLTAIAVCTWHDLRAHPVLAMRALVIAFAVGVGSGTFLESVHLYRKLTSLAAPFLGIRTSGLIVVLCHEFLVCAIAGWAVSWTHRAHRSAMVLWVAAALGGFHVWWSLSQMIGGWGRPGGFRFLVVYNAGTMIMMAGVLAGGFALRAVPRGNAATT
jgi:hypothetical protein